MLSARNECRSIIVRKARTTLRFEFEGVSTHMRFNIGTLSPAIFLFLVITFSTTAQVQRPESGISIQGTVKSGNTPLPGASVDAINRDSLEQVATTTDLSGRYSLRLPGAGTYLVTAEMTAFMTVDQQVVITDAHTVRADFDLILRSKSQTIAAQPRATLDANRRLSNAPPVEETANETGNGTDDWRPSRRALASAVGPQALKKGREVQPAAASAQRRARAVAGSWGAVVNAGVVCAEVVYVVEQILSSSVAAAVNFRTGPTSI